MIFGIRRWPIVPTLVVLLAAAIMVKLGFWQLDRLGQKEAMIAEFSRNAQSSSVAELSSLDGADDLVYRRVRFSCATPSGWTAVAGRSADNAAGYVHRYVCRAGEPALLADIGWSRGPREPTFAGGEISGVLVRLGEDYKVVASDGLAGLQPIARPDPNDMPNNHLAYAVQWFFFALTALVIYVLALRRRQREA
ncbi:SURF1 family protein [Aurantiacibacter flavus]|uniref:SURF1-like protein n=1 Tax=Aurantiacibacter flavus TaxID=3145232 RepID=A0ABV0CSC3_9SPHN